MNSVHDMSGMDGFGPIETEENELVFHDVCEGRMFGLFSVSAGVLGPWHRGRNFPWFRFSLESIPPEAYLRMSYYERWLEVLSANFLRGGLISERELETGYRDPDQPLPSLLPGPTEPAPPGANDAPAFGINSTVVVRNLHPRGHTRVPRYVRGKRGVVVTDNGVWALQDTDERGQRRGHFPQHVYTVRFESQELWGNRGAVNDAIYVDLWEEYLEPV